MTAAPIYAAAVRAWCAEQVARHFSPLWAVVEPNPLAEGRFCPACGTRLEGTRTCPFAPHEGEPTRTRGLTRRCVRSATRRRAS